MCKLYHGHSLCGYKNYVILNSICSCGSSIESTLCFLLHSPIFNDMKCNLLSTLNNIDSKILESSYSYLTQTCLHAVLIQKQERLFIVQPWTIFHPLKDSKNLCFRK